MASSLRSLKQALMPIIWLNCLFCMGIFEIPVNRPRFLLSAFYVVSMTVAYFSLLYKGLVIFQEKFTYDLIVYYCVLTINILVATLAIILFWCKSEVCLYITRNDISYRINSNSKQKFYENYRDNFFFNMCLCVCNN